ncbi:MAG: hypothetical protein M1831_007411 [Alyxoria varia]|nr:MAG: hypothetical protein M1831_007411 [Alyxoria varia]
MAPTQGSDDKPRSRRVDPVMRNALRYTISTREHELLQGYLISRAPSVLHKRLAPLSEEHPSTGQADDFNAATVRLALRLFVTSYSGLKAWSYISQRLTGRGGGNQLSLSLSSILFFHRILHRFFVRLREGLRSDEARSFRRRNPRTARALTSKLAPAVGASLSGLFLGISPADQTRITIAIYIFTRSLEFLYNNLDSKGYFKAKPWWLGSWLLMPLATGQLLHAFVFDRDCFPEAYGNFIMKRSPEYVHTKPADYPTHLPWPSTFETVDSLASISRLRWPAFTSPILFPNAKTLPKSLVAIKPLTDPAHPAIKRVSCAVLHPHDPSCLRTYISYYIRAFPGMARFWAIVYTLFALPRWRTFTSAPLQFLTTLTKSILRTSVFLTSAIGIAWSSICLLQRILPGHVLPTNRWFVSGFLAGLSAFVERGSKNSRSAFTYSTRMSLDSLWKVGKKHGWWRGIRNGDVLLFAACLGLVNVVYDREAKAVEGAVLRKGLSVLKGDGWVDRVQTPVADKVGKESREGEQTKDKTS